MEATKKESKAIYECYRRLYENSTPKADFDVLLRNAGTNEIGQKVINFMDYEIDEILCDSIIDDIIKEYKITSKFKKDSFKNTIYLGASPKFKS